MYDGDGNEYQPVLFYLGHFYMQGFRTLQWMQCWKINIICPWSWKISEESKTMTFPLNIYCMFSAILQPENGCSDIESGARVGGVCSSHARQTALDSVCLIFRAARCPPTISSPHRPPPAPSPMLAGIHTLKHGLPLGSPSNLLLFPLTNNPQKLS